MYTSTRPTLRLILGGSLHTPLLLTSHARTRTHDATLGNTTYMKHSLFQYFPTYVSHVHFSTIYTLAMQNTHTVLSITYSCSLTYCTLVQEDILELLFQSREENQVSDQTGVLLLLTITGEEAFGCFQSPVPNPLQGGSF